MYGSLFVRGMTKPENEQPKDENELEIFHLTYISFNLICALLLNYVMFGIIHEHYPRDKEYKELTELINEYKLNMSK